MQKKQAISYVRFSSFRQHGGSSVERQTAMIAEWLTRNPEYTLSSLKFEDLAKSGYHGDHIKAGGGFGKLLEAVKFGAIKDGDVVLVEAIDRTGRMDTVDMLDLLTPILKAGVSITTLDDGNSYNRASVNGSHIYMLMAKIQAANQYSEALSRRVTASYRIREEKARAGEQVKRWTPVWLTTEGEVIERIAIHIKEAFELYVSGVGKASIAVRMRETGVPELAKVSGPGVEGWLRNKTVIGYWNDIPNAYKAIIEPSLFYKAQIHAEKMKTKRPVKTAKNFLVGLVQCGACGKNYIMQNKDGVPHSMRCRTRQQLKSCVNSHIVPKPVLDAIYHYTSPGAARKAVEEQQMGVNAKEIINREAELMAISKRVENLAETVEKVGLLPEFLTKLQQAQSEREAAERDLTLLRKTVAPAANGWIQQGEIWRLEKEDPQRLAAMLRTVDYAITINPDGRITSSHSGPTYRYAGVDRREDSYILMAGEKRILVPKKDYPEYEPDEPDEPAESSWTEDDYEDLRRQHE
ncbi:recombinase family protein [Pseudomonas sp. GW101-3H06]|uniref:recombinase family protein n=1 Tax=Pseudomonas sp. GW101-3H06 TaxID=2751347 RepID=UPI001A91FEE5|nr:recombinase family protein [Pseudomonas sp. GW101-3H06]